MIKKLKGFLLVCIACLFSFNLFAQSTTLKGSVASGASKEKIPAVSVSVKGSGLGTYTDDKGNFTLTVPKLPVTLVFSSVGFENSEVEISSASQSLDVELKVAATLGQEVVVSATRVATRILESPVTIERVNSATIRNSPAASYYDVVANLKGVDIMASSLTFKTPTTRGFLGSGNTRFNQIVDGMDNQAPGLNFSVGSIIGLSELDVDNMELLPGASSALYGPGGMNGTLLINSKNPFKYQGLSFIVRNGIMHTDGRFRNAAPYYNWALRWGKKVSDKFAFKITSEILQAQDWLAADYRNYDRAGFKPIAGDRQTDPNYDGINVYGDENASSPVDIRPIFANFAAIPGYDNLIATLPSSMRVSRTGYTEKELVDPNTLNFKLGGSLNYKLSNNTEAILMGYWGTGNTVYTGDDRYSLKNLKMAQYKLEVNSKNWLLRAYTTQENSGDSYAVTLAASIFNEYWKPSPQWYPEYVAGYINARLNNGLTDQQAHIAARQFADIGRPLPGTPQFTSLFNQVTSTPIGQISGSAPRGGAKFLDRTDLYAVEGQYNLSHLTKKFADILVGGNFRRFVLNSQGTLFADSTGALGINEIGGYVQLTKNLINDKVIIVASARYDKNQNFNGRFTPRATAVIKLGGNNNLRLSYQTAYRFPSTQYQWINLNVAGSYKLIGGHPNFRNFYQLNSNPVYDVVNGQPVLAKAVNIVDLKPETVNSYEFGYKGLSKNNKILIDAYVYYSRYQDFLVRRTVMQNPANASTRRIFSLPTNTENVISTIGFGIGVDYKLPSNFNIAANLSSDNLSGDIPAGFQTFFNTPKYRSNLTFSNTGFGKQNLWGFSIVYRWMDEFLTEGALATAQTPAIHTVDAQVSYKLPKVKSVIKIGGSNILNQYYQLNAGNPAIGGLYYVSFIYNAF
jgi:outer membrane receptor protein involved in Fe transport